MLVLARKERQTIIIGDDIEVTVVEIRGDRVRLGIVANRSIEVDRKEVRESKLRGALVKAEEVAE